MSMQQYCLRWNNHQPNFISVFSSLLNSESLVDVTLSAEGRHLQAHKLVLSACSSYFQSLFTINPCQHPIVILKDVKFLDLKVIIDFMYYGEVNVSQEQLPHILKTAEMLKIKGLAEIPVEASVNKQNNSSERADLLTSADPNWSNTENQQRQSLSPSPCPLSPSSKRKRLRKSSTGSGSGSTERTMDDHPPNEVTLTSPLSTTIIKPDPGGFSSENNTPHRKQHSSDAEMARAGSHESVEGDSPHQITLQIPQQQEMSVQHSVDTSTSMDMAGPSSTAAQTVTDRVIISTHAQYSQSQLAASSLVLGPKRGRLLMRQSRIKREIDIAHEGVYHHDSGGDPLSLHTLTVPHVKVERQVSDPLPTLSPPAGSLLTVPGTNILVKQHSHPLLPSRTPYHTHSPPPPSISALQIHQVQHSHLEGDHDPDPLAHEAPHAAFRGRGDEPTSATTTMATIASSLRVRTEELKRSASSPTQTNTRSSHCPVVRPGPALGCNYCWNTVDTHGRILRRKTKYYCPECQTNLCIVPCFQEYHEQTDPVSLKTSIMRIFPKTSSM